MQILQVIPYFYPAFGGPVPVVYDLSRELAKRGYEISVYTTNAQDRKRNLKLEEDLCYMDGFCVRYFNNVVHLYSLFLSYDMIRIAKREISKFDLAHLHGYRTFQNLIIAHYAKKYGLPYILQAHGTLPRIMTKQKSKWVFDVFFGYKLLRDASKVIALNQKEAQQCMDIGLPREKIEIIPNGIDLSKYASLPPKGAFKDRFSLDKDKKMVLYLGRINRIKGIGILVKAFVKVIEKLEDVLLVVVGPDDGYFGELKGLVKALKIQDNVLVLGPLYGKDKLDAYVDADIYALPSRYDTFPMTVLEAMACGTPIILSENCGISEFVRDKIGLIVSPSPANLEKALLRILTDEKLQRKFKENCKRTVKLFDISNSISKFERTYKALINE